MSIQGKSWHTWLASVPDDGDGTPSSSTSSSSNSSPNPLSRSPSESPSLQATDDVMKLPKRDMSIFGHCPIQDEFVLVLCDLCHRSFKLEAFEHHVRLRHDRTAVVDKSRHAKKNASIRQCTVELTKEDFSMSSSSSSSLSHTPTVSQSVPVSPQQPSLPPPPPRRPAGQQRPQPPAAATAAPRQTSPVTIKEEEPMSVDEDPIAIKLEVDEEEADSTTTNNVISIPDTDPLPHSMSNDLMAMVAGDLSDTKMEVSPPVASSTNTGIQLQHPVIKLQLSNPLQGPESLSSLQPTPPPPTQTVQHTNFSTMPIVPQHPLQPGQDKLQQSLAAGHRKISPGKKGPGAGGSGRGERKPQREYHPDRHCGVWDNDGQRHCTRALTCKSHSVLLKRKIQGRSKPFDELVAEHKAVKEAQAVAAAASANAQAQMRVMLPNAAAAAAPGSGPPVPINVESVLSSITEPNPVMLHPALNGLRPKTPTIAVSAAGWSPLTPRSFSGAAQYKKRESDENLHYTLDHPRPLAVCTFGMKRLGGLVVSDRSQFLTRKVVRVALSAGGFRLSNGSGLKCFPNGQVKRLHHPALVQSSRPPPGVMTSRIGLSTLPAGTSGVAVPINIAEASFKTDIQDFKGGIKFELGRKIKHITPLGEPSN